MTGRGVLPSESETVSSLTDGQRAAIGEGKRGWGKRGKENLTLTSLVRGTGKRTGGGTNRRGRAYSAELNKGGRRRSFRSEDLRRPFREKNIRKRNNGKNSSNAR